MPRHYETMGWNLPAEYKPYEPYVRIVYEQVAEERRTWDYPGCPGYVDVAAIVQGRAVLDVPEWVYARAREYVKGVLSDYARANA